RFHKMELPEGRIKCGRMVKRASGWYLCLFINAEAKRIERVGNGRDRHRPWISQPADHLGGRGDRASAGIRASPRAFGAGAARPWHETRGAPPGANRQSTEGSKP